MSNGVDIQWQIVDQDCDLCASAEREGWWGLSGVTHCRMCHRTWNMSSKQAHCTVCCEHFSSPSSFDLHLRGVDDPITCNYPGGVVNKKTGVLLLVQKEDGVWTRPQVSNDWHTLPGSEEADD